MTNEIFRVKDMWRSKIYHTLRGAMNASRNGIDNVEVAHLDWKPMTEEDLVSRTKFVIFNKTKKRFLNRRGQATFLRFAHQYHSKSPAEQDVTRYKRQGYYGFMNDELVVKELKLKLVVEE